MNVGSAEQCPACYNTRWSDDPIATKILGVPPPFRVRSCVNCRLGQLSPYLTENQIAELYGKSYFSGSGGSVAGAMSSGEDYSLAYAPVRLLKFGHTLSDVSHAYPKTRRVLDVGAATGEFVKLAAGLGFEASGLEFSEHAVSEARRLHGLEIRRGTLANLTEHERFDFIHLSHVMEHFPNPAGEVAQIHAHLETGGVTYIEVPFQFHFISRARALMASSAKFPFTAHSLHHAYFYTPQSLVRLLTRFGFIIDSIRCFDPRSYPQGTILQRMKRMLWTALDRGLGLGNTIEVFARRGPVASSTLGN